MRKDATRWDETTLEEVNIIFKLPVDVTFDIELLLCFMDGMRCVAFGFFLSEKLEKSVKTHL